MVIFALPDAVQPRCVLEYDEPNRWLRATWRGFVSTELAARSAEQYLVSPPVMACAYLLNDNTTLHGPWFDSAAWLQDVWAPQAAAVGLRYIAHVVQRDAGADVLSVQFPTGTTIPVQLQLFYDVQQAEEWLRSCQAEANA